MLQVNLLVVLLDNDLRTTAPRLQGLDGVVKIHEGRCLDACLMYLLHEVKRALKLLLDRLG